MPPLYRPGQRVMRRTDRTQIGTISGDATPIANTFTYQVHFQGGLIGVIENDLEPVERNTPEELFRKRSFAGPESLLRLVTLHRLTKPFSDTFLTRHANRIDYLPYQWQPLLHLLDTADSRIFIADEVGLGKTIEAGIILRELVARSGGLNKILIVARSGHLNRQWMDEMRIRFCHEFKEWRSDEFVDWLERGSRDQYWGSVNAIIGRHTLMRDPALATIRQICTVNGNGRDYSHPPIDLDLLIVDESHHTRNLKNLHRAVAWLARSAKTVLFLSATPLHLGNNDLFNQLRILFPQRFANENFFNDELNAHQHTIQAVRELFAHDSQALARSLNYLADGQDISDVRVMLDEIDNPAVRARLKQKIESFSPLSNVINRTTRRNIPYTDWPIRRSVVRIHPLSQQEAQFYNQLLQEHQQAIRDGLPFGKIMPLRYAATCMPIAVQRYNLSDLNEYDEETTDERGEYSLTNGESLDFDRLADLPDSRFDRLYKTLEVIWRVSPESKVIVFCFFIDVLRYLSKRLERLDIGHVVIHGGIPNADRERLYESFLDRENSVVKVLLSSEVGSEGLNLQVADTIVNYNLPWNPMVVEQRIGRIDRKGQESKAIRIVNLFAEGTVEEEVLRRLYRRIEVFRSSIGDIEPILGSIENEIVNEFAVPDLSKEERDRKLKTLGDRIEQEKANKERLEEAARDKLAADLPFDPIEQARSKGRFVSSDHIRLLMEGFLASETPHSQFSWTDDICTIEIQQDLYRALTNATREINMNQLERHRFEMALHHNRLSIVFSEEITKKPSIELVAPGHWLVRAICHHMQNRLNAFHSVSALSLESHLVPAGLYVYGLFAIELTGPKVKRLLEPVFISVDSNSPIGSSHSQEILNQMLTKAGKIDIEAQGIDYNAEELLHLIGNHFFERLTSVFSDFRNETERFIRLRRQTEERYANAEIDRINSTIQGLVTEEQRRILPALQQNILNIEEQYDLALAELERQQPDKEYLTIGYGLLRIA